jgi:hypothetical protein
MRELIISERNNPFHPGQDGADGQHRGFAVSRPRRGRREYASAVNTQRQHITAKATLAAIAGLVLAGCSNSATTSSSAPATAGGAASSGAATTPGVVPAAALQFPVAVGNTWVYSSTVPLDGSSSTVIDKILSVAPAATGQRVAESYSNSLSSTTVHNAYIFHSDGSITLPLNQVSGGQVSSPSGGILLPPAAVIASGRPYRYLLKIGIKDGGKKMVETAHVTVQGAGTATVTVPAGKYTTTIIDVIMTWTVASFPVTIEIKDWFANGTGTVRSEALIREANLKEVLSTEELTSFTKG